MRAVDAETALARARAALAAAAQRLAAAGAAPEQLVRTIPARRALGVIPRRETFRRIGEAYLDGPAALAAEHAPLVLREVDGAATVLVRWMPSAADAALRPLDAYLAERLDLALGTVAAARAESEHP